MAYHLCYLRAYVSLCNIEFENEVIFTRVIFDKDELCSDCYNALLLSTMGEDSIKVEPTYQSVSGNFRKYSVLPSEYYIVR